MKKEEYRNLVVQFDNLAKKIIEVVGEEFQHDRGVILNNIRSACHYLSDIHMMIDMRENPTKVFAEFTPKEPLISTERSATEELSSTGKLTREVQDAAR